jgi:hypothetical protein
MWWHWKKKFPPAIRKNLAKFRYFSQELSNKTNWIYNQQTLSTSLHNFLHLSIIHFLINVSSGMCSLGILGSVEW